MLRVPILEGDSNIEGTRLHLRDEKEKYTALDLRSIVLRQRAGGQSSVQVCVFPQKPVIG